MKNKSLQTVLVAAVFAVTFMIGQQFDFSKQVIAVMNTMDAGNQDQTATISEFKN